MIWSLIYMVLGVSSLFVDGPVRFVLCTAALAAGAMYVRAMHRRARGDVR